MLDLNNYNSLKICFLIAFIAVFFIPKIAAAQIVINEVFSDPAGSNDTGKEWIKLYNIGGQASELGGWQINGSGKYFTLPSLSLSPNSFLLIRWRADGQNTASEIFTGSATIDTNIGNTSGFIALFKSSDHNKDTIVDYLEYGKAGQTLEATAASAGLWQRGQFLPSPGENQALRLKKDGQDSNSISDWEIYTLPAANTETGNINTNNAPNQNQPPGQATTQTQTENTQPSQPVFSNFSDDIFLNEFMPWPDPSTGGEKEWIELINTSDQTIDLSGWQIDDAAQQSAGQEIPRGTLIGPLQLLVIQLNKNILNNEGDQLRLLWPDGQAVHAVKFGAAKQNISSSRFENGLWLWTEIPTPGQENKKSAPKVINPISQPKTDMPLIAAVTESVSGQHKEPQKNSQPIDDNGVVDQSFGRLAQKSEAPYYAQAENQLLPKKTRLNIWLALSGIVALSFLTGIALIAFRRKKSDVDKSQKPVLPF